MSYSFHKFEYLLLLILLFIVDFTLINNETKAQFWKTSDKQSDPCKFNVRVIRGFISNYRKFEL